ILYALVFFTGKTHSPKLGLDLQGGTQVTLRAHTSNGQPPSPESMNQAREILQERVNGAGVTSAEVVIQNRTDLVITVTGENADKAKELATTAQMLFRPVVREFQNPDVAAAVPTPTLSTSGTPTPPGATPSRTAPTGTPSGSPSPSGSVTSAPTGTATSSPAGRVVPPL